MKEYTIIVKLIVVLSPCLVLYEKKVCQILKVHVHNPHLYKGQAQSTTITQHLDGMHPFLQNSHWEPVSLMTVFLVSNSLFPLETISMVFTNNKPVSPDRHFHGFHQQQQACFPWRPSPWFPSTTTSVFSLATIYLVTTTNNKPVSLDDHLHGFHQQHQAAVNYQEQAAVHAGSL